MDTQAPLAEQLRPQTLDDFQGQDHLTGPQGLIRILLQKAVTSGFFPSLLFWGPPGTGKTSLARIIASQLGRDFFEFSAVNASVKDIERIIPNLTPAQRSQFSLMQVQAPIVFIDEIHRFNKSQQDTLLPHVEKGEVILLGATTENPSFSINSALLSRCRVATLHQLQAEDLTSIIKKAVKHLAVKVPAESEAFLIQAANGDARVALATLEIASHLADGPTITIKHLEMALQKRQLGFDRHGEEYYNTISALHKSIRGSDPNAALYWLARMLEAGQDPLYIARRLVRLASEDIGNADPQALQLAIATYQACEKIGMPECCLALAQIVTYLAKAPKSNTLYTAYEKAAQDVQTQGNLPVPLHIRNAPTAFMKAQGYGKNYDYSHSPTGQKKEDVSYFPDELGEQDYLEGT